MHRITVTLALLVMLAACGGGGGTSTNAGVAEPPPTNTIAAAAPNVQPVTVDPGPANTANSLFTTVTVCVPGGGRCVAVDHVLVDTGSNGLRVMASVLPSSFSLPQQTGSGGVPVAECAQFVDGYSWGPVKIADVKIAGEQAAAVPVHIIGDPSYASVPASCSSSGPAENTVDSFGANGVLGVGVFQHDCGDVCATVAAPGNYYLCDGGGCQPTQQPLAQQVQNPVALFANDNNGVIVELPPIPATGAATLTGALVFGIGTQPNNGLGAAQVLRASPSTGNVVTVYKNRIYNTSVFDTGSTEFFFADAAIPICADQDLYAPGFYCPPATLNLAATVRGVDNFTANLNFAVANAHNLFADHPQNVAFDNLALPSGQAGGFIWGLPIFYGRSIFVAIENRNTSAGAGPYFAF